MSLSILVPIHPQLLYSFCLKPWAGTKTHIFLQEHSHHHQAPFFLTPFGLIPSFFTVSFVKTSSLRLLIPPPSSIGGVIPFSHLSTVVPETLPIFFDIARDLRKELKIPLVIFCGGNELERTDFKGGFAGIRENEHGQRLFAFSLFNKVKLALFLLDFFEYHLPLAIF